MKISVALCCRNGEAFLEQQLDSLLCQTILPDEIVISDDASSDATRDIIEIFVQRAGNLGISVDVLLSDVQRGISANFTRASLKATGDVIFLADQDDLWHPEKIAEFRAVFATEPNVILIASNAELIDAENASLDSDLLRKLLATPDELRDLESGDLLMVAPNRNLFTGATMAFRKTLLAYAIPFPAEFHHDDWLAQIAWLNGDVRFLFAELIRYRLHDANAVGLDAAPEDSNVAGVSAKRAHLLWMEKRLVPSIALINAKGLEFFGRSDRARARCRQYDVIGRRLHLSLSPITRIGEVRELIRDGGYGLFSNGTRSAISDMLRKP